MRSGTHVQERARRVPQLSACIRTGCSAQLPNRAASERSVPLWLVSISPPWSFSKAGEVTDADRVVQSE